MYSQTDSICKVLSVLLQIPIPSAARETPASVWVSQFEGAAVGSHKDVVSNSSICSSSQSSSVKPFSLWDIDTHTTNVIDSYWEEAQFSRLIDSGLDKKGHYDQANGAAAHLGNPSVCPLQGFVASLIQRGIDFVKSYIHRAVTSAAGLKEEELRSGCRVYLHYLQICTKLLSWVHFHFSGIVSANSASRRRSPPSISEMTRTLTDAVTSCMVELSRIFQYCGERSQIDNQIILYLHEILAASGPVIEANIATLEHSLHELCTSLVNIVICAVGNIYNETEFRQDKADSFSVMNYKEDEFFEISNSSSEAAYARSSNYATERTTRLRLLSSLVRYTIKVLLGMLKVGVSISESQSKTLKRLLDRDISKDPRGAPVDHGLGVGLILNRTDLFYPLHHLLCLEEGIVPQSSPRPRDNQHLMFTLECAKADICRDVDGRNTELQLHVLQLLLSVSEYVANRYILIEDDDRYEDVSTLCCDILEEVRKKKRLRRDSRLLLARCAFSGLDSKLWDLGSTMTDYCKDSEYVIRLFASTQVRGVFEMFEHTHAVYASFETVILEELERAQSSRNIGNLLSCLATLAQMAAFGPELERPVLFHFCDLYNRKPKMQPHILMVYSQLCLYFSDGRLPRSSAVYDNIDYLLMKWIETGFDLCEFPFELLSVPVDEHPRDVSLTEYADGLKKYQQHIVPVLVLNRKETPQALPEVARLLNTSVAALVEQHFESIFTRSLALYAVHNSSQPTYGRAQDILDFLKTELGEERFTELYHQRVDGIVLGLFDVATFGPTALLPELDVNSLEQSLEHLASSNEVKVPTFLSTHDSDRLQILVLHIRQRMVGSTRPRTKFKVFQTFKMLVRVLDTEVKSRAVFRPILDTILWILPSFGSEFPWAGLECLELLRLLIETSIETHVPHVEDAKQRKGESKKDQGKPGSTTRSAVGPHLREIVTALVNLEQGLPTVDETEEADNEPLHSTKQVQQAVIELVTILFERLPQADRLYIPLLDDFPSSPLYARVSAQYHRECGERTIIDDLRRFVVAFHRSCSDSRTVSRGLRQLSQTLKQKQEALRHLLASASQTSSSSDSGQSKEAWASLTSGRLLIAHVIGVLISFCREDAGLSLHSSMGDRSVLQAAIQAEYDQREEVKRLSACCLGLIGLVSPDIIHEHYSVIFSKPHLCIASPSFFAPNKSFDSLNERQRLLYQSSDQFHHIVLLGHLAHLLRDSNVELIGLAVDTLRSVFRADRVTSLDPAIKFDSIRSQLKLYDALKMLEEFDHIAARCIYPFYVGAQTRHEAGGSEVAPCLSEAEKQRKARADEDERPVEEDIWFQQGGVWDASEKTSSEWTAALTSHLIKHKVRDPFLKQCGLLSLRHPPFAMCVFPFIVYDILVSDDLSSGTDSVALASSFNQLVASFAVCQHSDSQTHAQSVPPSASVPPSPSSLCEGSGKEVLSLVFSALEHIRNKRMAVKRKPLSKQQETSTLREIMDHVDTHFLYQLDILDFARQAQQCSMYFTSLLLLEEWHLRAYGDLQVRDLRDSKTRDSFTRRTKQGPSEVHAQAFYRLWLECYRNIDDLDGIYGVVANIDGDLSQGQYCDLVVAEHESKWSRTLQAYDSLLTDGNHLKATSNSSDSVSSASVMRSSISGLSMPAKHAGLARSLQHLGCNNVLQTYLNELARSHTDASGYSGLTDIHFEAAWRTCNWDMPLTPALTGMGKFGDEGPHVSLFRALRTMACLGSNHAQVRQFDVALRSGQLSIAGDLKVLGAENTKTLLPALSKFQLLAITSYAWDLLNSTRSEDGNRSLQLKEFADSLQQHMLKIKGTSFTLIEPLMTLCGIVLQLAGEMETFGSHICQLVCLARQTGSLSVATNALRWASRTATLSESTRASLIIEGAQLAWHEGDTEQAVRGMNRAVRTVNDLLACRGNRSAETKDTLLKLRVNAYCRLAEWQSTIRSEGSHSIKENLKNALSASAKLQGRDQQQENHKIRYQFGRLMDRAFQAFLTQQLSVEHEAARALRQEQGSALEELKKQLEQAEKAEVAKGRQPLESTLVRDLRIHINRLAHEYNLDLEEQQAFEANVQNSLQAAIEHYCQCLALGDLYDKEVVYRLVALWFPHRDQIPNEKMKRFESCLDKVPSRKFIPLVYQIASRLENPCAPTISGAEKTFRLMLHSLIDRMAREHPHHTLYQIFALSNGTKLNHTSRNQASFAANHTRITVAASILDKLRATEIASLVNAQEALINAYIALADQKIPKSASGSSQKGNDGLEIKSTQLGCLSSSILSQLPICTATMPVQHDCNYKQLMVTVKIWYRRIEIASSGVNRPFILQLQGTDGRFYKQLVKTADDMRQDAVMEQLFALVNQSLLDTTQTARRDLRIRTYNVVPLTPCVGVVEWVQNTSPLYDILVGRFTGVHTRYRPPTQQKSYSEWMMIFRDCHSKHESATTRLTRYKEVCDDIPPAFHHFFNEQYPAPVDWFTKRLAFTRSMAANSIIGYIVGLGDRHNNNILVDKSTAEVIHIDLGVAFDLGKVLKTPEIVPFRLTRDLVDGMGIAGVEGVYRRCCEETMRVLRQNQEMMLTVLEVFLHDPLYQWSLSPQKLQQLRGEENRRVEQASCAKSPRSQNEERTQNTGAQRALFHVRQRLRGEEFGETLSVEGQVLFTSFLAHSSAGL